MRQNRFKSVAGLVGSLGTKQNDKSEKFFVVIAIIVVLVILLTPVRMNLKDGGSVRYKALVYEVTKIHRLAPEVDGVKPYIDGFEIKILGMTVYRETNE